MSTARWSKRMLRESGGMGKLWPEFVALNGQEGVVNLGQGFPDFDGYAPALSGVAEAVSQTPLNQYSPIGGLPELNAAVSDLYSAMYGGAALDPKTEIAVCTSATEALMGAMMGLIDEGDEVVFFEPFFPWYLPLVRLAGGVPKVVELRAPDFRFTEAELRAVVTEKTKVVMINTPHNPTGHVLQADELEAVARVCVEHDLVCVSDEVYENMVFPGGKHLRIYDFAGMRDRTLTVSGSGKMMSLTGWRIGWAYGPADLVAVVSRFHGFASYCAPVPLQRAVASALREALAANDFTFGGVGQLFAENYKILADALTATGAKVCDAQGGYFLVADVSHTGMSDLEYCRWLVEKKKVGCVPMCMFFVPHEDGTLVSRPLVRFAVCKQQSYIKQAAENILKD